MEVGGEEDHEAVLGSYDLNFLNRPVRTTMPGEVEGGQP